jgi:penicillin amidase
MNKLSAPNFSVEGFSFPGLPLVLIGRNEYFGWSLTSSADGEIDKVTLRHANEKVDVTVIEEPIKVAGWDEMFVQFVKESDQGVDLMDILASTVKSPLLQNKIGSVFLSSSLSDHRSNFTAFRLLNLASSFEEVDLSMKQLSSFSLNFVCAFSDGSVGFFDRYFFFFFLL